MTDYDPADNASKCYDLAISTMREKLESFRKEVIGDCTLYLGDCREILPLLPKVDAVVTDPPYGVQLGKDGPTSIGKTAYASYDDTVENLSAVCVPVIEEAVRLFGRVVLTPGNSNFGLYPKPAALGTIFNPAGAGFCSWGFTTSQPILYYGKDPHGASKLPQSIQSTETVDKNGHPCPKPIKLMTWLVHRASLVGETILDPFMGSGTTGVACVKLGRKFIGCEIDPGYFAIACKRIRDAYAQPDFFVEQTRREKPEQLSLMGEAE